LRVIVISDTHNQHELLKLPKGDILIHCGDFTINGTEDEVKYFSDWFRAQKFKYKLLISGNHDYLFDDNPTLARSFFDSYDTYYLNNEGVYIMDMLFWGYPFDRIIRSQNNVQKIPSFVDFFISHSPPKGFLDNIGEDNLGCEKLMLRLKNVSFGYACFGHIHQGYGSKKVGDCEYINASICDGKYNLVNKPIVIDL
jgi:hypothetical protein